MAGRFFAMDCGSPLPLLVLGFPLIRTSPRVPAWANIPHPGHMRRLTDLTNAAPTSSPQSRTLILTASTYLKAQHFQGADRLCVLHRGMLTVARDYGWRLEARAVFSNHYHFVGHAPEPAPDASNLSDIRARVLDGGSPLPLWLSGPAVIDCAIPTFICPRPSALSGRAREFARPLGRPG
jgi:hypothetical protein